MEFKIRLKGENVNIFRKKRFAEDLDRLVFYAILSVGFFLALSPFMATASLLVGIVLYVVKFKVTGQSFRRTPFDLPIAAFVLISGLSVLVSPDPAFSFYNYYNLVGRYVLLYILLVQNITTFHQMKSLLCALGGSALLVVLYGFYQYIFGIDISTMKWVDGAAFPELKTRVFSTWENPNILAGYLDIVMAIVFGLFCALDDKRTKWLLGGFFCLAAICLAMTYARGACLSIAIVIAGYGLLKDRRILLACILIAAIILTVDSALADRLLSIFNQMDTSSEMRLALWESTLAMVMDHPLLGIGWGAYWMVYPNYDFYINDAAVVIVHAHNMYLNFAAEIGVFGFLSFMVFFFGTLWRALFFGKRREESLLNGLMLGIGLAVLSIALNGLTDYVLFNIESSMLFWLLAAIVVLIGQERLD
jgi:putative inorganic carbon (hco3(-)) transporter